MPARRPVTPTPPPLLTAAPARGWSLRWRLVAWQLGSLLLLVGALGAGTVLLSERFLLAQIQGIRAQQAAAAFGPQATALPASQELLSGLELEEHLAEWRSQAGAALVATWGTDGTLAFDADLPEVANAVIGEAGEPRLSEGSGVLHAGEERYYWRAETLIQGQKAIGFGAVLYGLPGRTAVLRSVMATLWPWLLLAAGLALLSAVLFAGRLRRSLLNLEPAELAALTEGQGRLLQTVREGVIGLEPGGELTLANAAAVQALGLRELPVGVADIWPELAALPAEGDLWQWPLSLRGQVMRLNVTALPDGGRLVAFSEWQEATRLAEELTHTRTLVEAMRARAHEYGNRLHVVAGFLQLGQPEQALQVLQEELDTEQAVGRALAYIGEPRIAALLAGKMARARELRLTLHLAEDSFLPADLPPAYAEALMTALGNYLENAFEVLTEPSAAAGVENTAGVVRVECGRDPDGITLEVRDSGPGVPAGLDPFALGQSTKGSGRGLGLAGVAQLCRAVGGEVWTARQGEWTVFGVNLPPYWEHDE